MTMPSPAASPLVTLAAHGGPGNGGASPEFDRWAQHNLQPQRQAGYGLVWIKLPAGNISADQFRIGQAPRDAQTRRRPDRDLAGSRHSLDAFLARGGNLPRPRSA